MIGSFSLRLLTLTGKSSADCEHDFFHVFLEIAEIVHGFSAWKACAFLFRYNPSYYSIINSLLLLTDWDY